MEYKFFSREWIEEYKKAINESAAFKIHGATWELGAVALFVKINPQLDSAEDFGIWLNLYKGRCNEIKIVSKEEAEKAPFFIYGDYERWKDLFGGKVDILPALMTGKIRLKGNLSAIVKYIEATKDMILAARQINTLF